MLRFTADELARGCRRSWTWCFPAHVLDQLVAAIDAGKHVVLTGPPGTGKTTLAYLSADVGQQAMLCTGYLPTTATTEWTTFETIGGFQPTADGLHLPPRPVRRGDRVRSLARDRRAQPVELRPCLRSALHRPVGPAGRAAVQARRPDRPLSIVPHGVEPPEDTESIRVPPSWRIIATMNVFDKNLLFEMSYALMRRFAFIEVAPRRRGRLPPAARGPGRSCASCCRCAPDATSGPRSTSMRPSSRPAAADDPTESRLLYEVFYALLPSAVRGHGRHDGHGAVPHGRQHLDPPEQQEAQRTIVRGPRRRRDAVRGPQLTSDPTIELWTRLARPFDPAGAVEAFTGLHPTAARQLVGARLATSSEADQLLDRMHVIVRSLAVATKSSPTRTKGEVRGPVLWSETTAARASSPGASDVFICASPMKAYDTDENQVLVHALATIRDAAHAADPTGHAHSHDELVRRARHNGKRAIRALEHRTLASIRPHRPTARALAKARTGLRRGTTGPPSASSSGVSNPSTRTMSWTGATSRRCGSTRCFSPWPTASASRPFEWKSERWLASPIRCRPTVREGDGARDRARQPRPRHPRRRADRRGRDGRPGVEQYHRESRSRRGADGPFDLLRAPPVRPICIACRLRLVGSPSSLS